MLTALALTLVALQPSGSRYTRDHSFVEAEVGVFSRDSGIAISPRIFGRAALLPEFAVEVDVPMAFAEAFGSGDYGLGNLNVSGLIRGEVAPGALLEGGLGVAFGTADFGTAGLGIADAMSGFARRYAYLPGAASVLFPVRLEVQSDDAFYFDFEAYGGVVAATFGFLDGAFAAFNAEATAGARNRNFEARLTFGATAFAGSGLGDGQLYVEPGLRAYGSPEPMSTGSLYADLSLLMNIDEPGGFAFDEGGVYGVFIGLGYLFDR